MPASGEDAGCWGRDGWVRFAILLGFLFHGWSGVSHGSLPVEDGNLLFQRSYQQFAVADWSAEYAGYVAFLPNVLASLLCRLPTLWIPHAFALAAVLCNTAAACSLLHRGWEPVAPRRTRCLAALALAWLPLGNAWLSGLLNYSQWPMLLWLFVLLARPLPARGVAAFVEGVLIAALTWSHPLSMLLLPLSVWRLWRRDRTAAAAVHLVAALCYLWCFYPGGNELHLHQLLRQAGPYPFVRIVFESCCGTPAKLWLLDHDLKWLLFGLGFAMALPIAWSVRRAWPVWSPEARRFGLVAVGFAGATVAAALLTRAPTNADEALGQRYAWIARVCLVLVVVFALEPRLGFGRVLSGLVLLGLVVGVANRRLYRAECRSPEYTTFLQHLADEEHRLGDRRLVDAHLPRGDWPIDITPK